MKKTLLLTLLWFTAGSVYVLAGQGEASTVKGEMPKDQDKVKVYVKQDPNTYQKTKEASSKVEFAVQLSASAKPITDKKALKSWEDLGPVYVHSENGLYKLRIGPFDTQEDAKTVLLKAKARGTKDAFIVVQQGLENHKPYEFQSHPTEETAVVAKPAPVTKAETVATPERPAEQEMAQGEYKVRLASYLHPGSFNTKDVDQYGKLESYRQGDLTIMLIGGFKNEADAKKVRDLVISKGYKDATVVMDQDGILVETK